MLIRNNNYWLFSLFHSFQRKIKKILYCAKKIIQMHRVMTSQITLFWRTSCMSHLLQWIIVNGTSQKNINAHSVLKIDSKFLTSAYFMSKLQIKNLVSFMFDFVHASYGRLCARTMFCFRNIVCNWMNQFYDTRRPLCAYDA